VFSDNDMVMERDPENLAGFDKLLCDCKVLTGRL